MDNSEPSVYELLGLTELNKPSSPEQDFYEYLCNGAAPRIDNMLYQLRHDLEHFKYLLECNVTLSKKFFSEGVHKEKLLTNADYVRHMIEYHLLMAHGARFLHDKIRNEEGTELPKLNFLKTVDLFMEDDRVKKIIRDENPS